MKKKMFEKHVRKFILGLGYVPQPPVLMTEEEVHAEIEKQGGQIYQNVEYKEIPDDEEKNS